MSESKWFLLGTLGSCELVNVPWKLSLSYLRSSENCSLGMTDGASFTGVPTEKNINSVFFPLEKIHRDFVCHFPGDFEILFLWSLLHGMHNYSEICAALLDFWQLLIHFCHGAEFNCYSFCVCSIAESNLWYQDFSLLNLHQIDLSVFLP